METDIFAENPGKGELQKVAVKTDARKMLVYFPNRSDCLIHVPAHYKHDHITINWYNPRTGEAIENAKLNIESGKIRVKPPLHLQDGVLVISE